MTHNELNWTVVLRIGAKLFRWTWVTSALIVVWVATPLARQGVNLPLGQLLDQTHIHGLAVDRRDPELLFIATHHGLFLLSPNLTARLVSERRDDFMGFTPHPTDKAVLFSSGHPAMGGNLGFQRSDDGGHTWRRLSPGASGPVDFHQMDVSKADSRVIYGNYGGLQVSRDSGQSWQHVGTPRNDLIALAASSQAVDTVFIGTSRGLLRSTDGGRRWQAAHTMQTAVPMVHTTAGGAVFAYLVGRGLVQAREPDLHWEVLGGQAQEFAIVHLAVDPNNPKRMFAARQHNELTASTDGGRTWQALVKR